MKKLSSFLAVVLLSTLSAFAGYGILVNGNMYYEGEAKGINFDGYDEYCAHVQVSSGDYLQLHDRDNNATWVVDLNPFSEQGFTRNGDRIDVTVDGCYDFYIQLMYNADRLYIGLGSGCGAGTELNPGGTDPGTNPGGGTTPGGTLAGNPRFMWKAEIDKSNNWVEPSEITTFIDGQSEIAFSSFAYLFLIYQVDGQMGVQYMCETYTDDTNTHARFTTTGNEKWKVPVGTTTLYLYDNEDGSVEVSNTPMPGKKFWTATGEQPQGLELIPMDINAPMFNILGQPVDASYRVLILQNGHKYLR